MTLANFSLHFKPNVCYSLQQDLNQSNCMITYTKALTTRPLIHACVVGDKLLTLANFSLHFKPNVCYSLQQDLNQSNCMVTCSKALTTRPLIHACVVGGKLLTLTNFSLHFKPKSLLQSAARIEPIYNCMVTYTKALTTRPLIHACV